MRSCMFHSQLRTRCRSSGALRLRLQQQQRQGPYSNDHCRLRTISTTAEVIAALSSGHGATEGSGGGGGGDASSGAGSTAHAFDRDFKRRQRDNAARSALKWRTSAKEDPRQLVTYDYIREELAIRLVDRLDDIRKEEGFPLALDLGAGAGYIHRAICAEPSLQGEGGIGGVRKLVQLDSSQSMLFRDEEIPVKGQEELCDSYRLVGDEESTLPFPDGTFDLVMSSGSLHWVNQLPATLSEIKRVLKPDGCFMWAMIGGTTLPELRVAMVMAEMEREGGVSPHVGPFVGIADVGGLLQRAGFQLPTIDVDTFHVSFPNAATLMEHLQRMGESNACVQRRERVGRDTFLAAACIYDNLYGILPPAMEKEGGESPAAAPTEVEAAVNIIYAIGWTPHESQPKPLERGTAKVRIQDHLGNDKS